MENIKIDLLTGSQAPGCIFIYTTYSTSYPLSKRGLSVYRNRNDARAKLKEQVESKYGPWDQIPLERGDMLDKFTKDAVTIVNSRGDVEVYCIDEEPVHDNFDPEPVRIEDVPVVPVFNTVVD